MSKDTHKDLHKSQLNRLKRIEGQVRGITKMIEEDRYCMDILTQIKAIKSALGKIETNIIESHLDHCVRAVVTKSSEDERKKVIEEIRELLKTR